jgi:hypothetical protein
LGINVVIIEAGKHKDADVIYGGDRTSKVNPIVSNQHKFRQQNNQISNGEYMRSLFTAMESKFNFLIASPEPWVAAAPIEKRQPKFQHRIRKQLNAKTDSSRQHLSILLPTI